MANCSGVGAAARGGGGAGAAGAVCAARGHTAQARRTASANTVASCREGTINRLIVIGILDSKASPQGGEGSGPRIAIHCEIGKGGPGSIGILKGRGDSSPISMRR